VRGSWLVWYLPLCVACSETGERSGTLPEAADFLPMGVDSGKPDSSAAMDQDSMGAADGEQPRLVLRCEEGRVDAYLVVGTPAEVESGEVDARAVPVTLDSALSC
jgi:hypothetical protein